MTLSNHFKLSLAVIVTITVTLLAIGACLERRLSGSGHSDSVKIPATVLPSNDVEQIRVNPDIHKLIIISTKGTRTVTLPDRMSTIDVLKNGTVKVTSPQIGLEHHLFLGIVGADHARIGVGEDIFYFKKLDLGVGIADQVGMYTPVVFAKATYNIKGNLQLGVVYQSNQYIGGIVAVRIF